MGFGWPPTDLAGAGTPTTLKRPARALGVSGVSRGAVARADEWLDVELFRHRKRVALDEVAADGDV